MAVAGANVLVARVVAPLLKQVLEKETLYSYASKLEGALVLHGRAPVYAIPFGIPNMRVAVRHVMRGGWAGRLVQDRFFPPTRVARELAAAFRLRVGGVPTPEVLAVVTYPAGLLMRRADVMTRFIEGGADLSAVFADRRNDGQRRPILRRRRAAARTSRRLRRAASGSQSQERAHHRVARRLRRARARRRPRALPSAGRSARRACQHQTGSCARCDSGAREARIARPQSPTMTSATCRSR